jgi:hypothetical protein
MSFSKSRAGVGVVVLAVMLVTTSRGNAADFESVQLELPAQVTAPVVDFNLNFASTGSAALFYFDRESLYAQPDGGFYPVDSEAAAAAVSWEILWQQPALIPVSAVPEPTTATLVLAAAALLARRFRAKRTLPPA